jgi:DNA repair exonuclease SbcCD ATPase subunit
MRSDVQQSRTGRFFVKQAILLVVTIILAAFFAVPLLEAVKAAVNPGELQANADRANKEVAGLQTKLETANARILMGAGDDEAQEKLKKELQELKQQLATKELENKYLQDQRALVQTMLEVVKAKPAASTSVPPVDFWQKIAELLTKVIGCVGSVVTGVMFVGSWWKRRREGQPVAQN